MLLKKDSKEKLKKIGGIVYQVCIYLIFLICPLVLISGITGVINPDYGIMLAIIFLILGIAFLAFIVVWTSLDIQKTGIQKTLYLNQLWVVLLLIAGLSLMIVSLILWLLRPNLGLVIHTVFVPNLSLYLALIGFFYLLPSGGKLVVFIESQISKGRIEEIS